MATDNVTRPDTLVGAALRHGRENPDKLAMALKRSQVTYGELRRRILAAAKSLRDNYGLKRGDLVVISAISKPEYVIATLAAQFLGAATVPADKSARESAWADLLEIVQPKLVITDAPLKNWFGVKVSMRKLCAAAENLCGEEECETPSADDLAEIIFTTGTTGKPKGAMLTYSGIEASARNTWEGIGMLPSDRVLNPLPLHHSFGMRVLRAALWGGASLILQNGFTFAKDLEENLETYQCTGFTAVPATMETLYRSMGERFASAMGRLRYIEVSAGFLPVDMKKKLLSLLPDTELHNTWGSSESGGAVFLNASKYPDKLLSIGRPISGAEFKAVDADGETVEATDIDSAGRMALRGPMRMAGYFRNPEETAKAISGDWLLTNDLVYRDADGFIYMLGRADDIINVGGDKVSPVEIEEAAQEFEEIRECACIGVEDPEGVYGMVPALFVAPEGAEFHEEACEKFLLGRLERWKLPRRYMTLTRLPRNRMQKLDRKVLREIYERGGERPTNHVIQNILTRRSIRDFTSRPVSRDILETLAECGTYAPSGHNMQTWRFTALEDASQIAELKTVARDVAKRNKVYFYGFNNPAALILVSNDRRNADGVQDCSCAAENIMLAAHSLGLGSVWLNPLMTICDEPEIRALLRSYDVPEEHIVWATIALGYPAQEGRLLEKKRDVIRWINKATSHSSTPPPYTITKTISRHTNDVLETILTRFGVGEFANCPVSRDILETLVECGTYAPSGHNMQTWRFTVLEDAAQIETLETLTRRHNPQFSGFKRPAALILLSNDRRNPYGVQDCSCAAENILLAARSLGIGAALLNPLTTICDEPEIRASLRSYDTPDEHIVWACIALGYPA